mgnify:CR=1 FL=1
MLFALYLTFQKYLSTSFRQRIYYFREQLFYIIFSLFGMYVDVEVRTPKGRVDVVMCSLSALYVMELKLDKTADDAMGQIDLKNYPERFALCGLPVVKVGINFDSERRTLGEWKIEMA